MKVALFSYMYDSQAGGGAVRSVQALARGLAAQGDAVVVVAAHRERTLRVERRAEATVYTFRPWNLYWVGDKDTQPLWKRIPWQLIDIWNPHAFRVARSILRLERPDVVHVNKLRGLSPSVWAAARAEGIPVVHTCRDYELFSPEGTLDSRIGAWAEKGVWFVKPYASLRARFSQPVAAAAAPSHYTLGAHLRRGFFPCAVSQVVPNSHGMSLAQLGSLREDARRQGGVAGRLLYLGRLESAKGVDILCAAFAEHADRWPNLQLDLAGWGTLESELRERYGGHPQIVFHGAVFGETKARLLANCDAVVVPSVWPEVFGNVVAEAYAFGKPVIATRAGGLPEIVAEGETGWLVLSGDRGALADAIARLADDASGVHRMSRACLEAAERYAVEAVAAEYVSLYHQVVGNQRGADG